MNLALEIDRWNDYWRPASDPTDVERRLRRLHWLSDFAFSAGGAITAEEFSTVQHQIELGERKLTELIGQPFEQGVPKTLRIDGPQFIETARPEEAEIAVPETCVFE